MRDASAGVLTLMDLKTVFSGRQAPPAGGVELTLRVQGTARPRIGVTDWSNGLGELPGYTPRPPGVDMPPAGPPTDTVVTTRIHQP